MLTLGVCAAFGLHVLLLDNDKTIFEYNNSAELKSDNLLQTIDEALRQNGLDISNVDVLATNIGPGSFTGIRVAISLVKGMAIETNKKLIKFNSFDCFGVGNVVLSGFGKFVYTRINGKMACENVSDVKVADAVTDTKALSDEFGYKLASFNMKNIVLEKLKNNEFCQIEELMPLYLRASQAEIDREKNK